MRSRIKKKIQIRSTSSLCFATLVFFCFFRFYSIVFKKWLIFTSGRAASSPWTCMTTPTVRSSSTPTPSHWQPRLRTSNSEDPGLLKPWASRCKICPGIFFAFRQKNGEKSRWAGHLPAFGIRCWIFAHADQLRRTPLDSTQRFVRNWQISIYL